ncbi:MAG: ATP-dependent RNA helicase HrpA [Syntrophales bacterium]|nr:ATP-dependent RNA helicase HrpA [Syntrophales bacterium]
MERKPSPLQKRWEERQALAPKTSYPVQLPITARKEEIVAAIRKHQVLIIAGETGSGKSTQIPKMCLDAGRGIRGLIGCTQPRRVAAITVAQRIAEELGEQISQSIAYKIRFDEKAGLHSYIKLMTDGVLLMEAQGDRLLRRYDTIIVDEAHERNLNIDFIIGILRTILPRRPDMKVIITSATIDTEKFSQAFNKAPIIQISGRLYPVEVRYRPLVPEGDDNGDGGSYLDAAVEAVEVLREDRDQGDILIFMPTEQDIRETCDLLAGRFRKNMTILPMFSRLTWAEQQRVFQPSARQKIVVATNVAETSITIPNIRYVIDTGLARIAQYNPRTRTASLPIQNISRGSADQRQGRCGRVRNGICIRLYEKNDYLTRPAFTPPEIIRANLAGVVLRMLYLAIGDVYTFPFLDPPAKKQLTDAMEILKELGAVRIEEKPVLSDIGRLMARLPLDPRIARMIIEAMKRGCLEEILIITAALSIVDPRERPQEKAAQADQMHARFRDPASDFVTLLRIWNVYHEAGEKDKFQSRLRKFCREHFLSYRRMREWQDLYRQLRIIVAEEMKQRHTRKPDRIDGGELQQDVASEFNHCPSLPVLTKEKSEQAEDKYATIHKAILSGLLSGIAMKKEKNIYTAPKGKEAMIFPGSGLFKRGGGGQWIVAAEWVETSRLYARTVATIQPEWIEEVAGPLCRVTYSEPHWSKERGEVQAFAQVSLFGLLIIPRRIVSYGRIDPAAANDIFIREGLMRGSMKRDYPFLRYNEEVIEKVRIMENKLRRQGVFLDEETVFSFYRQRLLKIHDERTFQKYIRQQGGEDFLRMKEEDILLQSPDTEALSAWPDETVVHGVRIPLTYRFTPGTPEDGVTAEIPASIITALSPHSFEMAVPGLLPEQVHSLVRGLPKLYRKQLPSLKTVAETLIMHLPRTEQNLPIVLGRILKEQFGVTVPPAVWPLTALPDQLKMRFVVADENGQTLASGRDINSLHEQFLGQIQSESFQRARKTWERENITAWDFGDLPESIPLGNPGQPAGVVFPALEYTEGSINLRLFPSFPEAEASHRSGVAALFEKHFEGELKYLRKTLVPTGNLKIWAEMFGGTRSVARILYNKVIHDLFFVYIRNKELFIDYAQKMRSNIIPKGQDALSLAMPVLEANFQTIQTLNRLEKQNHSHGQAVSYLRQLRQELAALLPLDFLESYPHERISQLSRYICALEIRADRGLFHLEKALDRSREIQSYTTTWQTLRNDNSALISDGKKAAIDELFWMIEEYKVSLFAQELKTPFPVSGKRLERKIAEIQTII